MSEQAHAGSGGDGAAPGRTAPETVEEEGSSAAERKPASECQAQHQIHRNRQHTIHTQIPFAKLVTLVTLAKGITKRLNY